MKSPDSFKEAIKSYLDERSKSDELFAQKFTNPKKSIDECCNYIVGEALKNSADFTTGIKACQIDNDAIFGMAVHYYDEDHLKISKIPTNIKASIGNAASSAKSKQEQRQKRVAAEVPQLEDSIVQLNLFS